MSKEDSSTSKTETLPHEADISLGRGPHSSQQRENSSGENSGGGGGSNGSSSQSSVSPSRDGSSYEQAIRAKAQQQKLLNDPRFRIRPTQQVISACTGAMITACFMTPLDVIKTRMQSQQSPSHKCFFYSNGLMDHLFPCGPSDQPATPSARWRRPQFRSTWDALVKISRYEGPAALWSGLGPTLVSALPSTIIYFVAYEQFKANYKQFYEEHFTSRTQQLVLRNTSESLPPVVPMLSGVTARICAVTVVSPIELVRTKMQAQRQTYAQIIQFVRNVISLQGFWGLWRGLRPTILRDVPFSGIYWPIYEYLKLNLGNHTQPSFGRSFLAGVLAGSVAAVVTTPFDVVKTHEQVEFGEKVIFTDSPARDLGKRPGTFSRLKAIHKMHGVRGLFAGCAPRLLKVAPACAIMISSFEYSKSFFFNYNVRHHHETLLVSNPNSELVKKD
ncbi:solute carrier family 25 protein Shawn [Drosophila kikkawai]|uniref:Solute carrier family 25 protein Shawn n=1 Tax=Drosophila kikkawai TaxID=30033 RepID=A0A6P4JLS6_DROKI|nr:solute carrier family 25 member 40 [Drosophila kikkawai]